MKRVSQGGTSPGPKYPNFSEIDSDLSSEELNFPSQSTDPELGEKLLTLSQASSTHHTQNQLNNFTAQSQRDKTSDSDDESSSEMDFNLTNKDWLDYDSNSSSEEHPFQEATTCFASSLQNFVDAAGASNAASTILENPELRKEISKKLFSASNKSLKASLKTSKLTSSKKDRNYLLTLTPKDLCIEFQDHSNESFQLLIQGLLGIANQEDIFKSQFLLNNIAGIYSMVGRILNRNATGYALLLTTSARDGGLREDSLKLFSSMVHPRTSQRYDKSVLSVGWDTKLKMALKTEANHFKEQKQAEAKIEKLLLDGADDKTVGAAKSDLEDLLDTAPPQLQMVWDNLNLRTKHRFERAGDAYSDSNLDWMASMWIRDRIDANHMEHREGVALKGAENLSIKDLIPSEKEKDYIFIALIDYFSYRLVQRHPLLFKSISGCIKQSRPHQFQKAMDSRSEEFTANLFTQSESRTEDLITMMSEVQLNVHTFEDNNGVDHCHEKKIVSGDNKTEKNMHYGILRLTLQ
jgi:hypothetical protein